jgi:radical SAM superfamily enzyme YgiQ (UPF0313 family)
VHTTRGCAFNCVYCSVQKFWGRKVRRIPLALLFDHILALLELHKPVDEIQIVDDNFSHIDRDDAGNKVHLIKEFCQELVRRDMRISWKCQVRADQLDDEIITLLQKTGCFEVDIGVESGNVEIQKAIHKGLKLSETLRVVGALAKAGIMTKAFFILGFPGENYAQLAETINYALALRENGLRNVAFFPAMPFPGTELAEQVEKMTGRKPRRGGVMDETGRRYRSLAGRRLRKYSAMPEFPVNELFPPERLRCLVHFAYDRFDALRTGERIADLERDFAKFESDEEALIYGA